MKKTKNKYNARKCSLGDQVFDSQKERARYKELCLMERAGVIKDLKRQVKYELIPAQYSKKHKTKKGTPKCVEKAVTYVADFVYWDKELGCLVVEDVKGMRTEVYKIKRKLMRWVHGISIKEI